jgi:hypothetical protein
MKVILVALTLAVPSSKMPTSPPAPKPPTPLVCSFFCHPPNKNNVVNCLAPPIVCAPVEKKK